MSRTCDFQPVSNSPTANVVLSIILFYWLIWYWWLVNWLFFFSYVNEALVNISTPIWPEHPGLPVRISHGGLCDPIPRSSALGATSSLRVWHCFKLCPVLEFRRKFWQIKALRLCHEHYGSFTNNWAFGLLKPACTTPQTNGLVKRFNRTLKSMIRMFVHDDSRNWG